MPIHVGMASERCECVKALVGYPPTSFRLPSRQHRAPESCVSDITTRVLPSLLQNFLSHFPTLPIFFYFLHAIRFVSTPATTFLPSDATRRCFPLKEQKNRENLHETKKKGNSTFAFEGRESTTVGHTHPLFSLL